MSGKARNPARLTNDELEMYANDEYDDPDFDNILRLVAETEEESDTEAEVIDTVEDVIENLENSDTTVNISEENDSYEEGVPIYISKDNTKWRKTPFRAHRKNRNNIVRDKPGLTNYSANFETEAQAFSLFLTDELIDIIVRETNRKAEQVCCSKLTCIIYMILCLFLDKWFME